MQTQPNSPTPTEMHQALVEVLREYMGAKAIKQIYTYRERRRKDMVKLWMSYDGEDRRIVHALGKMWLRALDHTLWNVDGQTNVYFTPDRALYEMNIVGLCYEWHDFATFLEVVNKLPGYRDWVEEVETNGGYNPEQNVTFRTAPNSSDRLLRPTSAVFYDLTNVVLDDSILHH